MLLFLLFFFVAADSYASMAIAVIIIIERQLHN